MDFRSGYEHALAHVQETIAPSGTATPADTGHTPTEETVMPETKIECPACYTTWGEITAPTGQLIVCGKCGNRWYNYPPPTGHTPTEAGFCECDEDPPRCESCRRRRADALDGVEGEDGELAATEGIPSPAELPGVVGRARPGVSHALVGAVRELDENGGLSHTYDCTARNPTRPGMTCDCGVELIRELIRANAPTPVPAICTEDWCHYAITGCGTWPCTRPAPASATETEGLS